MAWLPTEPQSESCSTKLNSSPCAPKKPDGEWRALALALVLATSLPAALLAEDNGPPPDAEDRRPPLPQLSKEELPTGFHEGPLLSV